MHRAARLILRLIAGLEIALRSLRWASVHATRTGHRHSRTVGGRGGVWLARDNSPRTDRETDHHPVCNVAGHADAQPKYDRHGRSDFVPESERLSRWLVRLGAR